MEKICQRHARLHELKTLPKASKIDCTGFLARALPATPLHSHCSRCSDTSSSLTRQLATKICLLLPDSLPLPCALQIRTNVCLLRNCYGTELSRCSDYSHRIYLESIIKWLRTMRYQSAATIYEAYLWGLMASCVVKSATETSSRSQRAQ